jgi:hypothetical protein
MEGSFPFARDALPGIGCSVTDLAPAQNLQGPCLNIKACRESQFAHA